MPADSEEPSSSYTFIVHLWKEWTGQEEEHEWRGRVKSVPSGRESYFRHLDGMVAVVKSFLAGRPED